MLSVEQHFHFDRVDFRAFLERLLAPEGRLGCSFTKVVLGFDIAVGLVGAFIHQ